MDVTVFISGMSIDYLKQLSNYLPFHKIRNLNFQCARPSEIIFFVHKISCTQNCFRYTSVHMGDHAHKRANMLVTSNMTQW